MARKKIPETETVEQEKERKVFEKISNFPSRSEKTSWNRKMDKMIKLISKIQPLEEQIIELQAKKNPLLDDVLTLRTDMVNECIHPMDYLVSHENYILCKFCNRKLNIKNDT